MPEKQLTQVILHICRLPNRRKQQAATVAVIYEELSFSLSFSI